MGTTGKSLTPSSLAATDSPRPGQLRSAGIGHCSGYVPFVALLNRVIFSVRFWACLYLAALIYLAVPIIAQAASGPVAVVKSGPLDLECFWAKNRTALVCSSLTTVGAYVILSQGHIAVYRGAKLVYYGSR